MSDKVLINKKEIFNTVDSMYEAIAVARQFIYRLERAEMYEEVNMLKRQVACCFRVLGALANAGEMDAYLSGNVKPAAFDLSSYLSDIVSNCRSKARSYGVRFSYDADPYAFVSCDPNRLTACVLNLIANSLANVDRDEGEIRISVRKHRDVVAITVADNGFGLPDGVEPHAYSESDDPCGFSVLYKFCNSVGTVPVFGTGDNDGFSVTIKIPFADNCGLNSFNISPDLGTASPVNSYLAKIRGLDIYDIY